MKSSLIRYLSLVVIFISSYSFVSCLATEKASDSFLLMLSSKKLIDNRLNFEGGYQNINKENYNLPTDYKNGIPTRYVEIPYTDNALFFFENGLICYNRGLSLDSVGFRSWMLEFGEEKGTLDNWGTYEIKGDTINAIIYISYRAKSRIKSVQLLQSNFQGIIKNSDTIMQWHLVPPFQKTAEEFHMNKGFLAYLKTPKDLYFKSIPIKSLVDPSKAWINELSKKQ